MKMLKRIFAVAVFAALAISSFAQIQGAQTLSTTTLSTAIPTPLTFGIGGSSPYTSNVCLASLTNVYATVSVGTTLWVDTEAMDVVTNSIPPSGTCILVQRGSHGTKAEGHASGRTVFVGRPNLYQGFDVAGTCWANATGSATLPSILPWINLTDGNRYNCKSDGNWYKSGVGSASGGERSTPAAFCTGTVGSAATEYLNGAACSGASTATFSWIATSSGELADLYVNSSAAVVGGTSKDVLTLYVNGSATALTCTIAAAGTTCSDTTHGVAIVAGNVLTFQFVTATSDTAANISASVALYGQ
jgi:hypothetical protein